MRVFMRSAGVGLLEVGVGVQSASSNAVSVRSSLNMEALGQLGISGETAGYLLTLLCKMLRNQLSLSKGKINLTFQFEKVFRQT